MSVRSSFLIAAAFAAACSGPAATSSASPTPSSAPSTGGTASTLSSRTSTWDGVYTTAQAAHGATLFAASCDKCHGAAVAGTSDDGGRLVGKEFFEKYDGVTLDRLFTTIYTLMPLDNPKSLPLKDVADITAYLLAQNQMPAGSAPLSADATQLKGLKISADKP
jgi:cytochrome c